MSNTIVAIGAHTGDVQLTCGMLLAKQAMRGDKIITIDLTAGERGAPQGMTTDEFREKNIASAEKFAKMIGGESIVFDEKDGELYANKEIELKVATILRQKQATHVLYHWKNSLHKDHRHASVIADNAVFFASLRTFHMDDLNPAPIRRTLYAENWEDAEDFKPYFYFDVSEAFPLWKEAIKNLWLAEHSKDFPYLRFYEALAISRGARIKADYATAFGIDEYAKINKIDYL
ncbi:MAG: PIG-L family deacetylase [Eubacteriales bacterium]|nr:PIG-L family deacetylase [Eubacteriales bacterium]